MHCQTCFSIFSAASRWNNTPLRAAVLSLMLLVGGWVGQVQAKCVPDGVTMPSEMTSRGLPSTLELGRAPIGGVLARYQSDLTGYATRFRCEGGEIWGMEKMTVTLPLQDAGMKIYESGVTGIGIRIRFHNSAGPYIRLQDPPFQDYVGGDPPFFEMVINTMVVEFIRTGLEVGSGPITPFDVRTLYYMSTAPYRIPIAGIQLKTTIVNKIYFTSCYNPAPAPTVNLGRPAVGEVKQGNTVQKDFSLDIRCDGMTSTTKPPVSIYFEGNSPRDGLLLTDGQGQAGMAQGVGVALTNDKGTVLPFSKAKALPMTWTSSGANSEFYRFQGKARYVASGGEVKAGKADATLTYVLQYN